MKQTSTAISLLFLIIVFISISFGQLKESIPSNNPETTRKNLNFSNPVGLVNDFENIFSERQERILTKKLKKHEKETTDQIVVVTLSNIEPYENINDYSIDLANHWGIGQKEKNNGILIALGKNLRQIRIQNGIGIENRLTDAETKRIIDEIIIPAFKRDNYFGGLQQGIDAIIKELK
jgi:uncharacterized protein